MTKDSTLLLESWRVRLRRNGLYSREDALTEPLKRLGLTVRSAGASNTAPSRQHFSQLLAGAALGGRYRQLVCELLQVFRTGEFCVEMLEHADG